MSEVPQTHPPAESASKSKPPAPPPTEDQMERVRDLASQLYYGFKKRPSVGAEGRAGWEARFMRKFHAMLKILVIAKFDELPPFAIGCIWENNRRLRLGEPRFDPEHVVSAKSPGHAAYQRYDVGRLRYTPAFEGSPMSLKRERDIRDNWWRKSAPVRRRDDAPAPQAVEGMQEGDFVGEVGIDGEPKNLVNKNTGGGAEGGATGEGESEVEEQPEDVNTGPSAGTRGRRGRSREPRVPPVAAPVGGIPTTSKRKKAKGAAKTPQRSTGALDSDIDIDASEADRGRPAGKANSSPALSQGAGARTRSASRIRAAAAKSVANAGSGPSRGTVQSRSNNGKGKQPASTTLTLYDLQPERVVSEFIEHPRPCDRCRKLKITCIFNPLSRSYCQPCKDKKAKCSNAFKLTTDHCMATYLGYATYRMVSDPAAYAEPTFTPTNLPDPLPTNIAWFRALYNDAKKGGQPKSKKAVSTSLVVASSADEEPAVHAPAPPAAGKLPRDSPHLSRGSTPLTEHSRSVSLAPSIASSTMPGSSAVSVEQPPPSISAMSEDSHLHLPEVPGPSFSGTSHRGTLSTLDDMSVDDEERHGDDDAASNGLSSDFMGEGMPPRLRSSTSNTAGKMATLTVRGSEFEIPSTARQELGAFPPPPRGAARRATSIHLVPRPQQSWKALPSLGARMPDGHYSVVPPPHNEDWIARWETSMTTVGGAGAEPWNAHRYLNSHAEPPSAPERPPSPIITVSAEVQRIVGATRELFDEIGLIKERMQTGARLHNRQSREVLRRRPSIPQQPLPGDDDRSLINLEDVSSIFVALEEVYNVLTRFSTAFECIPAIPVNWEVFSDLLTQIQQLQDLYKSSWEHFASLQEDVRPLRGDMLRIRLGLAHAEERLDGILNDAASACEPLIHNLYRQIDTRLTRLETGGGPSPSPLPPQLGDILKILTRLSERVEQLERAAEADDFHTRIDGYISRYLADRGLHDVVLRQLGTGEPAAPSSISAGSSISHVLQAAHHQLPPSAVSLATPVPASALPTTSSSAALKSHGAVSAPPGIQRVEPPLQAVAIAANTSTPLAAAPSGRGSSTVPAVVAQSDVPARIDSEGEGIAGGADVPQTRSRSVVSKMYPKTHGGASSSRRRGC